MAGTHHGNTERAMFADREKLRQAAVDGAHDALHEDRCAAEPCTFKLRSDPGFRSSRIRIQGFGSE